MRAFQIPAIFTALLMFGGEGFAAAPEVPSAPPYIVLSDNLDEPKGYGFCIDTLSRGLNDLMQAHSCKPRNDEAARDAPDNDVRFMYKADTQQVASYAYEGLCMQALISTNRNGINAAVFALLQCSDAPRQKFVYNNGDSTLRLDEDQNYCVGVVSETATAGPFVARAMVLKKCEELDDSLKQWTVVAD